MQRYNMPDPKYGYDILIILMGEDTPSKAFEPLSSLDDACECGALAPVLSFPDMPSLKAAILAEWETFPLAGCPTEKTVISVTGPMRCILN